ncbi:MAG TPA: GNAT family N-acetyltransferase [Chitinophagaceae bacterium]|nr:GNAT family N-acetyltransferase [Chitinophagaceae bacterium]
MNKSVKIQYLKRKEIDILKWDNCISNSSNGLIYGYSFYLDNMSGNWDALVMNDYEAVMPLTWNKKYTIQYIYQPFLTAQLGVFGNNLTAGIVQSFLKSIPQQFKYWDFYLNHKNVYDISDFLIYQRSNFTLDLNMSYDEIYSRYRENTRRNIKKSLQAGCVAEKGFDAEEVIQLAIQQMRMQSKETEENISRFRNLYKILSQKGLATTYGIFSARKELLASCVFFFSHNRAYYILVGNHPNGKTIGASHALIDAFIKDNAGQKLILDFEGSDIRNLAFFYSSFGATEEKYAAIKVNHLPFFLRWLKK